MDGHRGNRAIVSNIIMMARSSKTRDP